MKKKNIDASKLKKMTKAEMLKINGGTWIEVPQPDGTTIRVWV